MKVHADPTVCIGAGLCVLRVPEVFDQSDDGTVVVLDAEPGVEHDDAVAEAVAVCRPGRSRSARRHKYERHPPLRIKPRRGSSSVLRRDPR
jgi:ferredoxin